jgi:site-specific DNA-methyltransferase (adenine-specific)
MTLSDKPSIELLHGDCMDYMATLPDNAFELAIVDPPYGIGEDGSKNHTRGKIATAKTYKAFAGNDTSAPDILYFKEMQRVSKNQIIWGANHFIENIPNQNSPCWIVWDKQNGETDFADCELAWSSFKTAVRKIDFRWQGMLQGNMKQKETRIHPTQKPVALYRWLLHNYAKQGDRILDTHLGSGSSAIACHGMGFDMVGIELDADYYTASVKRFKEQTSQLGIFT